MGAPILYKLPFFTSWGQESWITKEMFDSELSHQSLVSEFIGDRTGQKGGGIIILVRSALSLEEKSEYNSL